MINTVFTLAGGKCVIIIPLHNGLTLPCGGGGGWEEEGRKGSGEGERSGRGKIGICEWLMKGEVWGR